MKGGLPHNFGQLESMHDSATGETTYYQYDLFGNLLRVDLPDGRAIEYDVDGAGRRVGRRELDADGFEVSFRGWIYRDLLRPIAEVDELGNVVARYVYEDGYGAGENTIDLIGTRLGAEMGFERELLMSDLAKAPAPDWIIELDGEGNRATTLRLVRDLVGSPLMLVDIESGEIAQRSVLDDFGNWVSGTVTHFHPFGFGGGLYDATTGLVRFGARDYDSRTSHWTAREPRGFNGKQRNFYLYANGDPINQADRDGEWIVVVVVVAVALATTGCGESCPSKVKRLKKKLVDECAGGTGDGDGRPIPLGESRGPKKQEDNDHAEYCKSLESAVQTAQTSCAADFRGLR